LKCAVEEFGGLDILVNNAGGEISPPFLDTRGPHQGGDPFQRPGALRAVAPGGPAPSRTPGRVHHQQQLDDDPRLGSRLAHHTAKTAESQLTLSMAADLGPRIRVNAVLPGTIETEALRRYWEEKDDSLRATLIEHLRMKRFGTPDDVASAVIYLASPAASWVTGLLLEINGGQIDEIKAVSPDL
jgi:7-alpha-hydroxysteroid dehydrogenase